MTRQRILVLDQVTRASDALATLAPDDSHAIDDGRLFADRRRVESSDELLAKGQRITWNAARSVPERAEQPLVLGLVEGFVAAAKPPEWSSEPDRTGSSTSLREQVARVLNLEEVHVLTRLDVGVSGLVLAATDAESRRHWAAKVNPTAHRNYLAILVGAVPDRGTWHGAVEQPRAGKSRNAVTHFHCLERLELPNDVALGSLGARASLSLVRFSPETGHRHQLRIHGAKAGFPIVGDRRYGGPDQSIDAEGRVRRLDRIYLHAQSAELPLPSGKLWRPRCEVGADFSELWQSLGGTNQFLRTDAA